MYVSCGETCVRRMTDIPSLLYSKLFSHRTGTGTGRNQRWIALSTKEKAYLMPGLTRWIKYHSFWGYFCRADYAVCGCLLATLSAVSTDMVQPQTFSTSYYLSATWSLINPPRWQLTVITLSPIPPNQYFACGMLFCQMTKTLLVDSGKYTRGGGVRSIRFSKWARNTAKWPPSHTFLAYQFYVTWGCMLRISRMSGRIPMPYYIMAKGYPWVVTYFLCKKWPDTPTSRTTRVTQWRQQLKLICVPLGHLYRMDHSIAVQFYLLNVFGASIRRKYQPSSWEHFFHRRRISQMTPSILASIPPHSW